MANPRKTSEKKTSTQTPATKKATANKAIRPKPAASGKDKLPPKKKIVSKPKTAEKITPKTKTPTTVAKKAPAKKSTETPVIRAEKIVVPVQPPKPVKPSKPVVDPDWIKTIREALVQQRQRLLSLVQSTAQQMAERNGDLPDVSDRASEGTGDELAASLMAVEAGHLDEIEAAIRRIDDGSYGLCADCNRAIPRKRLEVLPFAQRCLDCKGASERRSLNSEAFDDDDREEEHDTEDTYDAESESHE